MPRKPRMPSMVVKKTTAQRVRAKGRFRLRVGTPNEMGDPVEFVTRAPWMNAARAAFTDWVPWCQRYNKAGEDILYAEVEKLNKAVIGSTRQVFECCFDELSGMKVRIEIWEAT